MSLFFVAAPLERKCRGLQPSSPASGRRAEVSTPRWGVFALHRPGGRSRLLRILARFPEPSTGSGIFARFDRARITRKAVGVRAKAWPIGYGRRSVSRVPQSAARFPDPSL